MKTTVFFAAILMIVCPTIIRDAYAEDNAKQKKLLATVYSEKIYSDQTAGSTSAAESLIFNILMDRYILENRLQPTKEEIKLFNEQFGTSAIKAGLLKDIPRLEKKKTETLQKLQSPDLTDKEREKLSKRLKTTENLLEHKRKHLKNLSGGTGLSEQESQTIVDDEAMREIKRWRFNEHLYKKYGGRLMFQQFGLEPVDAYKKWLTEHKKNRTVEIFDADLGKIFWARLEKVYDDDKTMTPSEVKKEFGTSNPFYPPPWLKKDER